MTIPHRTSFALALAAICCATSAGAQQASGTGGQAAPAAASAPVVAPEADRLLQAMGAYLGAADEFTFRAETSFDHVLPTGQTVEFGGVEEVGVQRPNRVYVDWQSDLGTRQLWYDGSSVTLTDPDTPFYAAEPAPDSIDATLAMITDKLGFTPPLGDFLHADPYAALRDGVRYGVYLGTSEIGGRECHSLAFVDNQIDWQIWIDSGPRPTPCKLLITYVTRPGSPRFSAVFTDWDFSPKIAASRFVADVPPGSGKIPFKLEPAAVQP
ncbi:MAG: DUF2092 domain-containing protein [Amaricoccus sp.]